MPTGEVMNRAQVKEDAKVGTVKFVMLNKSVSKVRVFGDAAVVTGRQFAKRVIRGQELDGQESFTEVYVKEAGKWRCASMHVSRNVPLPEKKP